MQRSRQHPPSQHATLTCCLPSKAVPDAESASLQVGVPGSTDDAPGNGCPHVAARGVPPGQQHQHNGTVAWSSSSDSQHTGQPIKQGEDR